MTPPGREKEEGRRSASSSPSSTRLVLKLTNELGEDVQSDLDSCDRGDDTDRYNQNQAEEDWETREERGAEEKKRKGSQRAVDATRPSFLLSAAYHSLPKKMQDTEELVG